MNMVKESYYIIYYKTLEDYEDQTGEDKGEILYWEDEEPKNSHLDLDLAEKKENGVITSGWTNCCDFQEIIRKDGKTISNKRKLG